MLSLKTKHKHNSTASFTLVELLIVIAILAILASAIVIVINPGEILANSRDSVRIRDLSNLNRAINLLRVQCPDCSLGDSNTIYVSIPDTDPACANLGLPPLPHPWIYSCVTSLNSRNINGTGWMPVNFTASPMSSPLSSLPIDPVNSPENGQFYIYTKEAGRWKLTSLFESERHARSMNTDGGPNTALYEVGSNLNIANFQRGLVGQWSFEGTGSITSGQNLGMEDTSGRNNHGTASNANATGMAFTTGQVGGAISLDGVDDRVSLGSGFNFHGTSPFTIEAWINPVTTDYRIIVGRFNAGVAGQWLFFLSGGRLSLHREIAPFSVTGGRLLSLNTWHHVVGTYDGSNMRLFLNGVLDGGPRASGSVSSNIIEVFIGSRLSGGISADHFNGLIDEVRIYNRALSASEVRANFNAGR